MKNIVEMLKVMGLSMLDDGSRQRVQRYIWQNYYGRLVYYLSTMLSPGHSELEDLAQEVMLKVYRSLDRVDWKRGFSSWFYTVARNCSIDYFRRKSLESAEYIEETSGTGTFSAEEEAMERDVDDRIRSLLLSLDESDREMAFLRFYEGLKYEEISRITGRPVGTVKYRFSQIKSRLKSELEEYL